jgi:predicted MPP superfamily phosphohydrolase
MHPLVRAITSAGALGAAGLGYAALIERNAFVLRRFTLPILPLGADPLRVVQMSDLHLLPRQERKIAWVQRLADFGPDLVINTGDNLAHLEAVPAVTRALEPLYGIPGVFALGSNDYYGPRLKSPARYLLPDSRVALDEKLALPTGQLIESFTRDAGWLDLNNARGKLTVSGLDVEFVGVDDPHLDRDRYAEVSGPRAGGSDLFLGVLHAPYTRVLDAMAADGVDAIIAGHTHGGQLCLPGYGALVTNCDLDRRRAKGVSRWWPGANGIPSSAAPADAAYLHVSAGLGTSPFAPVRFACRPEASLITLVPRA